MTDADNKSWQEFSETADRHISELVRAAANSDDPVKFLADYMTAVAGASAAVVGHAEAIRILKINVIAVETAMGLSIGGPEERGH
ncbi:MAG: hypothetical protein RJQ08_13465 [Salinisphaeraceae bacterium]